MTPERLAGCEEWVGVARTLDNGFVEIGANHVDALRAEVERLTDQCKTLEAERNAALSAYTAEHVSVTDALAASEARVAELEDALYPLVVGALEAEAREDAPEYVNNEPYNGMRALPECVPCGGTGATDLKHYEDVPIPDAVRCAACDGWGFLKHDPPIAALAETEDDSSLKAHDAEVVERVIKVIEGGRFLHDEAPTAQFAREVVAAIRRETLEDSNG